MYSRTLNRSFSCHQPAPRRSLRPGIFNLGGTQMNIMLEEDLKVEIETINRGNNCVYGTGEVAPCWTVARMQVLVTSSFYL